VVIDGTALFLAATGPPSKAKFVLGIKSDLSTAAL